MAKTDIKTKKESVKRIAGEKAAGKTPKEATKETKKIAKKETVKKPITKEVAKGKEPKPVLKKRSKKFAKKPSRYYEAIGRRKTSVAIVRLFTRGDKDILVNNKKFEEYFPTVELQSVVTAALRKMKSMGKFRVSVKARGGGIRGQAEAARHGTARALTIFNPDFRKRLRKAGFLTRDPRKKERKKFGLKKARRAPQWQKR